MTSKQADQILLDIASSEGVQWYSGTDGGASTKGV